MTSVGLISPAVSFFRVVGDWMLITMRVQTPSEGGFSTNAGLEVVYRFTMQLEAPEWVPPDPMPDPPVEEPPPPEDTVAGLTHVPDYGDDDVAIDPAITESTYIDLLKDSTNYATGQPVADTVYEVSWTVDLKKYLEDNPELKKIIINVWGATITDTSTNTWPTRVRAVAYEDIRREDIDVGEIHLIPPEHWQDPQVHATYKGKEVRRNNNRDPMFFGPEEKQVATADFNEPLHYVEGHPVGDFGPYTNRGYHICTITYDFETLTMEINAP